MKNALLTLAVLLSSTAIFSQNNSKKSTVNNDVKVIKLVTSKRNNLKGPAYKNFKPWKKSKTEIQEIQLVTSNKSELVGPEYKNYKVLESAKNKKKIKLVTSKRSKLTGPAYKNYKPWQ
ncbi:hypothetical protein [Polaribacter sp.]|uniref:hypothetical protein n=1 Tax=Polaribacter sp. TaxID=1920175 RepID=UPI003F6D97A5